MDAVDINLGCPQSIAKRHNFGAFLMDDLPRVRQMVTELVASISVPVTCKIRCFPHPEHTVAYARMLVDAGCQMLAVHGRTREQKDGTRVAADWDVIRSAVATA